MQTRVYSRFKDIFVLVGSILGPKFNATAMAQLQHQVGLLINIFGIKQSIKSFFMNMVNGFQPLPQQAWLAVLINNKE